MPILFADIGSGIVQFMSGVVSLSNRKGTFYTHRPTVINKLKKLGMERAVATATLSTVSPADIDTVVESSSEARLMPVSSARQLAGQALADLGAILRERPVDGVFVWNGSGVVATAAILLARKQGIPTVFGENGYLPGIIQIDPQGVNQLASITGKIAADFARISPNQEEVDDFEVYRSAYLSGKSLPRVSSRNPVKASAASKMHEKLWKLRNGGKLISWGQRLNRGIPKSLPDDLGDFVLLPMQVVKDSQVLCHSPLFGNDMPALIRSVRDALVSLGGNVRLMVKLHPAERGADYSALSRELPDVLFVRGIDIRGLIAGARAVVTVNSTVGYEALVHGKGVVMAGDNFYRVDGVVYAMDSISDMAGALRKALEGPPDRMAVENFLVNCHTHYFVKGSAKDFSEASLSNVAARIDELVSSAGSEQNAPVV